MKPVDKSYKNFLSFRADDAAKFGYVTIITRYRGAWNGKTYQRGVLLVRFKGSN